MYFSSLLVWGTPSSDFYDQGCSDKSDISQDMDKEDNSTCGNIYVTPWTEYTVDWEWFACKKAQKCIHINNRCDLHPHPDCLYEKVELVKERVVSSLPHFTYS